MIISNSAPTYRTTTTTQRHYGRHKKGYQEADYILSPIIYKTRQAVSKFDDSPFVALGKGWTVGSLISTR